MVRLDLPSPHELTGPLILFRLFLHHGLHDANEKLAELIILIRMPWRLIRVAHAVVATVEKVDFDHHHHHGSPDHPPADLRALQEENARLRAELQRLGDAGLQRSDAGLIERAVGHGQLLAEVAAAHAPLLILTPS